MWGTLSGRLALVLASLFFAGATVLVGSSMHMPRLRELLEAGAGLLGASIAFALLVALLVFRLLARRLRLLAREMEDFRASRFTRPKHLPWARNDGDEIDRLAFAFGQLWWGITQPFAGAIADRYGSGRVLAVGGVLYVLGMFVVTMIFNVPLNNALAATALDSVDAAAMWQRYMTEWVPWNHVRSIACTASLACFIMALRA